MATTTIDFADMTEQLLKDGACLFAESFEKLMADIRDKKKTLQVA